jgi:glutathione S-transferase
VINEYLEERYPEPALLSADAADRALVRLQIFRFDGNLGDAYYALRRGDDDGAERLSHCLVKLEGYLQRGPRPYTLADISYLPWIVRARDMLGVDLSPYPALSGWLAELSARPAVAAEIEVVAALPR